MASSAAQRSLAGSIGAHTRWSRINTPADRAAATAKARAARQLSWERQADPDGVLPPDELAAAVDRLKRAHFARMALRSAQARTGKRAA
jgi:hypothetical protein